MLHDLHTYRPSVGNYTHGDLPTLREPQGRELIEPVHDTNSSSRQSDTQLGRILGPINFGSGLILPASNLQMPSHAKLAIDHPTDSLS